MNANDLLETVGVELPADPRDPPGPPEPGPEPEPEPEERPEPEAVATFVVTVAEEVSVFVVVVVGLTVVDVVVVDVDVDVVAGVVVDVVAGVVVVVGATVVVVVGDADEVVVVGATVEVVVVVVGTVGCARERINPPPERSDPVAKHAAVDGHTMSDTAPVTAGSTWEAHVDPPSPLAKTWLGPPPSATAVVLASAFATAPPANRERTRFASRRIPAVTAPCTPAPRDVAAPRAPADRTTPVPPVPD